MVPEKAHFGMARRYVPMGNPSAVTFLSMYVHNTYKKTSFLVRSPWLDGAVVSRECLGNPEEYSQLTSLRLAMSLAPMNVSKKPPQLGVRPRVGYRGLERDVLVPGSACK